MIKAVFLDRDGTINLGIPLFDRVDSPAKLKLFKETIEALSILSKLEFLVFIVTNQAGIAEGLITKDDFDAINSKLLEMIEPSGVKVTQTYVCPHGENSECDCRKPKPGLLFQAAKEYAIDLQNSWMIGDRETDVLTGLNAGTKTILVKTGINTVASKGANFTADNLVEAIRFVAEQ